jgi:hypothetical protein
MWLQARSRVPDQEMSVVSHVIPPNEVERLQALYDLRILDTSSPPGLDRICRMAQQLLAVPIAAISLLDETRQWFAAKCGTELTWTPREHSFCRYTILHDEAMVVPDASVHADFAANPFVTGEPGIRFYAGAPLVTRPGIRLGSLCVIDREPRDLTPGQIGLLTGLARLVVDEFWVHRLTRLGLVETDADGLPAAPALDFGFEPAVTSSQVRAARGLLNWSVQDLASAAGVSPMTVKRLEASRDRLDVRQESADAVRTALEQAGIVFTFGPGSKPGIRPA